MMMCILFVCSERCFYRLVRIDWGGWELARGEDERGCPTRMPRAGVPSFLVQSVHSSPFDHQSIFLVKDHFMGTAKIV